MLELVADVEVVLYGPLSTPRNDGHNVHSGLYRLLYPVLDKRLRHNRKHLFWHRLCSREKPRTVTRCRKQTLFYHLEKPLIFMDSIKNSAIVPNAATIMTEAPDDRSYIYARKRPATI